MSRIRQVRKLSETLGISPESFLACDVLDPVLGVDIKVFVDPQLLFRSKLPEFNSAREKLERYFADTFRIIKLRGVAGSRMLAVAAKRLTFKETKGVGIGFGKGTDDGNGIGAVLAKRLAATAAEIHDLSVHDPAIFELLGLFEEDFGPDRLSDLVIYILHSEFLAYTQRVAKELKIPNCKIYTFAGQDYRVPFRPSTKVPLILLPLSLLRHLPIASDPSEIDEASYLNQELREEWRQLCAKAWREHDKKYPDKDTIKKLFLNHPSFFQALLKAYKDDTGGAYDFATDPRGLFSWADLAFKYASEYPLALKRDIQNLAQLEDVVFKILEQFRRNIQVNGLNKLLFKPEGSPQREAYSQLLFFASADAYCRANGLDLSPESDAGRGPVDFKISKGNLKIFVELKLSTHKRLMHGYETQLEIYREAEAALMSFFVIIKVKDGDPPAIKEIRDLIGKRLRAGEKAGRLFVIDGVLYPSASRPQ